MLSKLWRVIGGETRAATSPLYSWWVGEFTPEERRYMEASIGVNAIISRDGSLGYFGSLTSLCTWLLTGDDVLLALRIMAKAVEIREAEMGSAVDRHFTYTMMIQVYYQARDRDRNALALALEACEKQIALAPQVIRERPDDWAQGLPAHLGFQQLAIVRERERDFEAAISLSEQALSQGWTGDWERRIARCRRKLNERNYVPE